MRITTDPGSYILKHIPTGLFYIGSTNNLYQRLHQHKSNLIKGKHPSQKLQNAFTNWDDMRFDVTIKGNKEEAFGDEQLLLDRHVGHELCCNISASARSVWGGGMPRGHKDALAKRLAGNTYSLGLKRSAETLEKMSKARVGLTARPAGFKHSDETRRKIGESNRGNKTNVGLIHSEESRANMRAAQAIMKEQPGYTELKLKAGLKRAISVSIEGVIYPSTRIASEKLGLNKSCIDHRLRSNSDLFEKWFFIRN